MVEEAGQDVEGLCNISEAEIDIWKKLAPSTIFQIYLTNRDGGSCLLLPAALFTGSYAFISSVETSIGEYEETDSSSCRSRESS